VPLQPDVLLTRFTGARPRKAGTWTADCPVGLDAHPVTIVRTTEGLYRFSCSEKHAGSDVLAAVDLNPDDVIRPPADKEPASGNPEPRITLSQRIVGADDYRPPKVDPLVAGWLNQRGLAFVYGPPKSGKSLFALDLVCSVTAGLDWLDLPTTGVPSALYVAAEAPWTFPDRFDGWRRAHPKATPRLAVLPEAPRLNDAGVRRDLLAIAPDFQIIVIDTLARCTPGVDENTSKEMGVIVEVLAEMAGHALVVVVHHGRKNGPGMRGSSVLLAAADTVLEARRVGRAVSIGPTDQRSLPTLDVRIVRGIAEPGVLVPAVAGELDDEPDGAEVVALLVDGMTRRQWIDVVADAFGQRGAENRVRKAIDAGLAENRGSRQAARYYRADAA
jgi:hypothetical protein